MSLVNKAKKRAKKLNIEGEIFLSTRKGKKLKILTPGNKWIHFGSSKSQTFLEGASEEKRQAYQARASKIKNKEGQYTYMIPGTPNYYSYNILW